VYAYTVTVCICTYTRAHVYAGGEKPCNAAAFAAVLAAGCRCIPPRAGCAAAHAGAAALKQHVLAVEARALTASTCWCSGVCTSFWSRPCPHHTVRRLTAASSTRVLLQALAFVPELSPKKQPVVNKKQLAVLSMWICGIPC